MLLQFLPRTFGGTLGEFRVGGEDRDGVRLRHLLRRHLEKPLGERIHSFGASRNHREIFRIAILAIDTDREDAHRHLLVGDEDRHGGRHEVGGVGAEQQVGLIDRDQFGVEAGNVGGIALVVVDDDLDRPAEQAAPGIDVVAPKIDRRLHHLAGRSAAPGQRQSHPDLDRIGGLGGCGRHQHA